jgi:AAA domain
VAGSLIGGLVGGLLALVLLAGRQLLRGAWAARRWWVAPLAAWLALLAGLVPREAPGAGALGAAWLLAVVGCTLLGSPWSAAPGGWGVAAPEYGRRTTLARGKADKVWRGDEPPPRRWAVPKLIPYGPRVRWRLRRWWVGYWLALPVLWPERRGYVTAVVGDGGTGKSFLLCDLATALLTGGPWLGLAVQRVKNVLYCDAELDLDTMKERAWQIARGRGLDRPPKGLHYLSLPCSVATPEGMALVAREVRRTKAELVLFDSLTIGSAGIGLADASGWNALLAGFETWGVPVVAIDHQPKHGTGPIGSVLKIARLRSIMLLDKRESGAIGVEHAKHNFSAKVPDFAVKAEFAHTDPDDPAPGAVRFSLAGAAPWAVDVAGVGTPDGPPEPKRPRRWGVREQAALDVWAARGAQGATVGAVADELRRTDPRTWGDRSYKTLTEIAKRLDAAGALRRAGTVRHRGRPPAGLYVATGQDVEADAVAQAEALLRAHSPRAPRPGGPEGGAGGAGEA